MYTLIPDNFHITDHSGAVELLFLLQDASSQPLLRSMAPQLELVSPLPSLQPFVLPGQKPKLACRSHDGA